MMNPLLRAFGIKDPPQSDAQCPCCGQVVKGKPQTWIDARWDPLTRYLEDEIDIQQFEREVRVLPADAWRDRGSACREYHAA